MEHDNLIYGFEIGRMKKKDNRVRLPDDFRRAAFLNSQRGQIILRLSEKRMCLEVYDHSVDDTVDGTHRPSSAAPNCNASRLSFALSRKIEIGMDDRITIPRFMREAAGLDDHVVFLGTGHGFEIWNPHALVSDKDTTPILRRMVERAIEDGDIDDPAGADDDHTPQAPVSEAPENLLICAEKAEHSALVDSEPDGVHGADKEQVKMDWKGVFADRFPSFSWLAQHCQAKTSQKAETREETIKRLEKYATGFTYRRWKPSLSKYWKPIVYTTPMLTLEDTQWVIVVEREYDREHGHRRVVPMWRFADTDSLDAITAEFPSDWQEMENHPQFDANNRENLGLPDQLQMFFRAHSDDIMHSARVPTPLLHAKVTRAEDISEREEIDDDGVEICGREDMRATIRSLAKIAADLKPKRQNSAHGAGALDIFDNACGAEDGGDHTGSMDISPKVFFAAHAGGTMTNMPAGQPALN